MNIGKILLYITLLLAFIDGATSLTLSMLEVTVPGYSQLSISINTRQLHKKSRMQIFVRYLYKINEEQTQYRDVYNNKISKDMSQYSLLNFNINPSIINIKLQYDILIQFDQQIISFEHKKIQSYFIAIIDSYTTRNYMLPFNMQKLKLPQLYFLQYNHTHQHRDTSREPFMPTYWTQLKRSISILPYIPYLNQCKQSMNHLMINNIIQSHNCQLDQSSNYLCLDVQLYFNCISEQQQIQKTQQPWFNKKEKILYYLFQSPLNIQQIQDAKAMIDELYTLPIHIFDNLVPMYYARDSWHKERVNSFQITFSLIIQQNNQFKIVKAQTVGRFNNSLISPNYQLNVKIRYFNQFEAFFYFKSHLIWYALFAIALSFLLYCIICIYKLTRIVVDIQEKVQIFIVPAIKGIFLAFMTVGLFFFLIYQIIFQTGLKSISSAYDSGQQLQGIQLQFNQKGRASLGVLMIGIYLLNASIKQVFKVPNSDELKIVFEDDLQRKGINKKEQKFDKQIQFTKKNMDNLKNYSFNSFMGVIIISLTVIYFLISLTSFSMVIVNLICIPFSFKFFIQLIRYHLYKQIIYFVGSSIGSFSVMALISFLSLSIGEFCSYYFSLILSVLLLLPAIEILFEYLLLKIQRKSQDYKIIKLLYKLLQPIIETKKKQSPYEKALYYSSILIFAMLSILLKPFIFIFAYMMEKNYIISLNFIISYGNISNIMIIMIILIPIQLFTLFLSYQFLNYYCDINIQQVVRFNHFKFKKRKFRWMNDEFSHNQNIGFFYQQYEKFSFSSQLYHIVTMMGLSVFFIYAGVILIIQSGYLFFKDPVVVVMIIIIWVIGDIMSIIVSFIAVKLKLYDKNEEEVMRQNLVKIDKYLKKDDTAMYLELEGVKDYFLHFNRNWIIKNLGKIFTKQDFQQNNGELINKYKKYKSEFLKKEFDKKRKIKQLKQNHSNIDYNSTIENQIVFDKQKFNKIARPIAYYWYCLAKQNLYFKKIVQKVKKQKIKEVCQFCYMNVQIQPLQKKNFQDLLNEFRVINVGRIFCQQDFLQFYRLNQQYITICADCKDKNKHIQQKITSKSVQFKLMLRWYMIAKSNLLHKSIRHK